MARVWSWYLDQNRLVTADPDPSDTPDKDKPWERVVKAVPVEVVGAYTALVAITKAGFEGAVEAWALLVMLGIGFGFTVLAMTILRGLKWSDRDLTKRKIARVQIIVALLAFFVWAYAQGGAFAAFYPQIGTYTGSWYNDTIAALSTVIVGFIVLLSNKIAGIED
jgi:hypothetical protein